MASEIVAERVEFPPHVLAALEGLGVSVALVRTRLLPMYLEAPLLVAAERDRNGREHLLAPAAARAWNRLTAAARSDGVDLAISSAFRSIERQTALIRRKLENGVNIETVLSVIAPPGFSEHHSGRAVDVTTPGCPALDVAFADTEAFRWLSLNASDFGFMLSYPEGNVHGYAYEPWHWCFHEVARKHEPHF